MSVDKKKSTRKHGRHLRVPVLPDEEAEIKRKAALTGLTVAAYLRNVGIGYQVTGIIDNKEVEKLLKINGDLGRLGGLLKLWLTDDVRTKNFSEATIRAVLDRIADSQNEIINTVEKVIMPKKK